MRQYKTKALCFFFLDLNLQNPDVQIWILLILDLRVLHGRFFWGICKQLGPTKK